MIESAVAHLWNYVSLQHAPADSFPR
jgi:hypothetical protein